MSFGRPRRQTAETERVCRRNTQQKKDRQRDCPRGLQAAVEPCGGCRIWSAIVFRQFPSGMDFSDEDRFLASFCSVTAACLRPAGWIVDWPAVDDLRMPNRSNDGAATVAADLRAA